MFNKPTSSQTCPESSSSYSTALSCSFSISNGSGYSSKSFQTCYSEISNEKNLNYAEKEVEEEDSEYRFWVEFAEKYLGGKWTKNGWKFSNLD